MGCTCFGWWAMLVTASVQIDIAQIDARYIVKRGQFVFQLDVVEVIHRRFPGPWASAKLSNASVPTMWGHCPICKLEVNDAAPVPREEK